MNDNSLNCLFIYFQDESSNINTTTEQLKKSTLIKQLKEYDTIRLEAAKMQRDACKLEYENAILENVSFIQIHSGLKIINIVLNSDVKINYIRPGSQSWYNCHY